MSNCVLQRGGCRRGTAGHEAEPTDRSPAASTKWRNAHSTAQRQDRRERARRLVLRAPAPPGRARAPAAPGRRQRPRPRAGAERPLRYAPGSLLLIVCAPTRRMARRSARACSRTRTRCSRWRKLRGCSRAGSPRSSSTRRRARCSTRPRPSASRRPDRRDRARGLRRRRARALRALAALHTAARATSSSSRPARTRSPRRTARRSDALRTALDAGELGQEGFVTSLRLGGRTVDELKRIVFAPPPTDD